MSKKCAKCKPTNKEKSVVWELIKDKAKEAKRWFIMAIVILVLWFATIGVFVGYLSLYDFSSETTTTEITQDGDGTNIIGDGNEVG